MDFGHVVLQKTVYVSFERRWHAQNANDARNKITNMRLSIFPRSNADLKNKFGL